MQTSTPSFFTDLAAPSAAPAAPRNSTSGLFAGIGPRGTAVPPGGEGGALPPEVLDFAAWIQEAGVAPLVRPSLPTEGPLDLSWIAPLMVTPLQTASVLSTPESPVDVTATAPAPAETEGVVTDSLGTAPEPTGAKVASVPVPSAPRSSSVPATATAVPSTTSSERETDAVAPRAHGSEGRRPMAAQRAPLESAAKTPASVEGATVPAGPFVAEAAPLTHPVAASAASPSGATEAVAASGVVGESIQPKPAVASPETPRANRAAAADSLAGNARSKSRFPLDADLRQPPAKGAAPQSFAAGNTTPATGSSRSATVQAAPLGDTAGTADDLLPVPASRAAPSPAPVVEGPIAVPMARNVPPAGMAMAFASMAAPEDAANASAGAPVSVEPAPEVVLKTNAFSSASAAGSTVVNPRETASATFAAPDRDPDSDRSGKKDSFGKNNFQSVSVEQVNGGSKSLGINQANFSDMIAPTSLDTMGSSLPARSETTAATSIEGMSRLIAKVEDAAARISQQAEGRVEVKIDLAGGEQVEVRLTMHEGQVRAAFHTSSAGVRDMLAQAWSDFARPGRTDWAEPSFTVAPAPSVQTVQATGGADDRNVMDFSSDGDARRQAQSDAQSQAMPAEVARSLRRMGLSRSFTTAAVAVPSIDGAAAASVSSSSQLRVFA